MPKMKIRGALPCQLIPPPLACIANNAIIFQVGADVSAYHRPRLRVPRDLLISPPGFWIDFGRVPLAFWLASFQASIRRRSLIPLRFRSGPDSRKKTRLFPK